LIILAGSPVGKSKLAATSATVVYFCGGAKNRHQKMIDYIGKLLSNGQNATSLAQSLWW
jgi:hypothetical protein